MSFRLQCYTNFSGRMAENSVKGGNREKPAQITVTGDEFKRRDIVAANTNTLFYNDDLGGFEFLWIQSTRAVTIELTTTGTNTLTLRFELNGSTQGDDGAFEYGLPFVLGGDATLDDDDAAARISVVRIYNEDTTEGNDATVLVHAIN